MIICIFIKIFVMTENYLKLLIKKQFNLCINDKSINIRAVFCDLTNNDTHRILYSFLELLIFDW